MFVIGHKEKGMGILKADKMRTFAMNVLETIDNANNRAKPKDSKKK